MLVGMPGIAVRGDTVMMPTVSSKGPNDLVPTRFKTASRDTLSW